MSREKFRALCEIDFFERISNYFKCPHLQFSSAAKMRILHYSEEEVFKSNIENKVILDRFQYNLKINSVVDQIR